MPLNQSNLCELWHQHLAKTTTTTTTKSDAGKTPVLLPSHTHVSLPLPLPLFPEHHLYEYIRLLLE